MNRRLTIKHRLRKEKAELLALSAPPPSQPPKPQKSAPLDPALLPASSAPILDALHANTTLAPRVTARLNAVRDRLELATDVFAHAVHGLEQDGKEMDGVAGRVMDGCEGRLGEREKEERGGGVGMRDVLRALGGVMPGGARK